MNISDIINTIAVISFNDDNPSADDRVRILRYVNLANQEVFRKIYQIASPFISTSTTLTLTSGAATLPTDVFKIVKVVDTTNTRILTEKSLEEIEDLDPALTSTGQPKYFYRDGASIKVWPTQDVSLRFRYVQELSDLVDEASAASIVFPAAFHSLLIDGGLYYMFEDERDQRAVQEIVLAGKRFDSTLSKLLAYYRTEGRQRLRTEYHDF